MVVMNYPVFVVTSKNVNAIKQAMVSPANTVNPYSRFIGVNLNKIYKCRPNTLRAVMKMLIKNK